MTHRMTRPWHMILLCIVCLWVQTIGSAQLLAAPQQAPEPVVIYVDNRHAKASDSNAGTQDKPLKTIAAAAKKAKSNRGKKLATVIRIADGTYREQITLNPGNGSPITFEAINPGKVIISGSDVWGDWKAGSNGVYTHEWTYDWGVAENPWGDDNIDVPTIVRRYEMIFVNGKVLRQVLKSDELAPGTFMVDEGKNLVSLKLPEGVKIADAQIEVSTRHRVITIQQGDNVTLRGLVVQHGNEVLDKSSTWFINMKNVLVENSVFQWNNGVGLKFTKSDNVTVRRSVAKFNGIDGMNGDKLHNLLMEDNITAHNNWRGQWGDFYGWAIGQKFLYVTGAVIRNHQSYNNQSRGFWFDTDNSNIVFEGGIIRDNRRDGMFIEANGGPITVKNSTFARNGNAGILINHSEKVTLESNTLCNNVNTQLRISGTKSSRTVTDWENDSKLTLWGEDMTFVGNTLVGYSSTQLLFESPLSGTAWNRFEDSLTSNNNRWFNASNAKVFRLSSNKKLDLKGWQSQTGQDGKSTFADPGALPGCQK
jgi:hypothetical protein